MKENLQITDIEDLFKLTLELLKEKYGQEIPIENQYYNLVPDNDLFKVESLGDRISLEVGDFYEDLEFLESDMKDKDSIVLGFFLKKLSNLLRSISTTKDGDYII